MISFLGVMIMGLFGCSSGTKNFTPEQVVSHALEEEEQEETYYGEIDMLTSVKDGENEKFKMKEWRSGDGKVRMETTEADGSDESIAVNDGNTFVTYEKDKNQAYFIDDPELLAFNQPSPKEQAQQLLEMIRDTHDISNKGSEKIAGRETYHLTAKAKETNTLFGDQELWIDKENWMVLKMTFHTGDTKTEMTYTKIDFDADIPSGTFEFDLPEDVEMKNLNDINNESEITLEEAQANIGEFYYFPEADALKITAVDMIELTGELKRKEVNIDYKQDGLPLLTLTIFDSPEEMDNEALDLPGEKKVTIRGTDGFFTDTKEFRSLVWQEKGKNYSILLIDPNLTLDELKDMASEMEIAE
jgi:outer membrane lipoprotein-sorting protein